MPELPPRMARLPRDKHGRPVPYFVAWIDGEPDFRIIDPVRMNDIIRFRWCWVCGQPLGGNVAYVIGPMCTVNRVSSEPPSHRDCAVYSASACPFLTVPHMRRREARKPEGVKEPAGTMIRRNPGTTCVWITRGITTFAAPGGRLWDIGEPRQVLWFAEGREATRGEVLASIDSGLPLLRAEAEASREPAAALAALEAMHAAALQLIPAESGVTQ